MGIFDCDKCNQPDNGGGIGGWSVHVQLWNKVMFYSGYIDKTDLGTAKGMICIDCFEKMLGRTLDKRDFTNTIDNKTNSIVQ